MSLTLDQLMILKNDINNKSQSGGDLEQAVVDGNNNAIVTYYNTEINYWVWRTSLDEDTITSTVSNDGTTDREFAWVGTGGYIDRLQGERDAWNRLFHNGVINPSRKNVRQALANIFSGSGVAAINNREHMLALALRLCTRAEQLFSIEGSGLGNNGSIRGSSSHPDILTFEGLISLRDIRKVKEV